MTEHAPGPGGRRLSCPWCGAHDQSDVVNHPTGRYLCACGSLHNGTDAEWRRLREHREEQQKRTSSARPTDAAAC